MANFVQYSKKDGKRAIGVVTGDVIETIKGFESSKLNIFWASYWSNCL